MTQETDLLIAAAYLTSLVTQSRAVQSKSETRLLHLERQAIAARMKGARGALPPSVFTSAERLFAWACACAGGSERGARLALVTAPRLNLPLDVWAALLRDTELELDLATSKRPHPQAIERLKRATVHRQALALLVPVLDALSRGKPLPDTPSLLRDAAQMFEGGAASGDESEAA